jgi:mannosylglycerate hydrolase
MAKKKVMHVISGTHWDREWRHTAEQSKPRLADLIDTMIETLEKNKDYKTFCLDGGLVVLEDYFTVRPENMQRIKKLISSGRVTLVNWYTLPDTFTVAPEAMVRNIKLGQTMAQEFGGTMNSGYTATSYGQTSQLPQLYQGFGITNAIFYRGTNKYFKSLPLIEWSAKDGSKIHLLRTFDEVTRTNWFFYVHQPLVVGKGTRDTTYTYSNDHIPSHCCDEMLYERGLVVLREKETFDKSPEALKKALGYIVDQAGPYAVANNILALNMEDNDVPFNLLPEMISELNKVSGDIEIVQSSMDEYMAKIVKDTKNIKLPTHQGELRNEAVEHGFNGLLGATHSSRIKLKIYNEKCETGLIYYAEPLASMASLLGIEYPETMLKRAWRHLLLNQAHDSICGAAVDRAHEDMLYNFSLAQMVSEEITARSELALVRKLNTAAAFKDGDYTVTLFNTLHQDREEVLPIIIDFPLNGDQPLKNEFGTYFDIIDENGKEYEYELLASDKISIGVERALDTKGISMPAERKRIVLKTDVPAMGYKTLAVRPRPPRYIKHPKPDTVRVPIAREEGVLENEFIKVTVNPNGTFSMLHKPTGHLMGNMHYYTDNGEVGNAHLSRIPDRDFVCTTLGANADITIVETNNLRGTLRIDLSITVPAAATDEGNDRLREVKVIPITTWLTLTKGGQYLKVHTKLHNEARDHRLRVNYPSGIKTDKVDVESAFAVDTRDIRVTYTGDNFEKFYAYQPMQNFIDLSSQKASLAVLNKGLREYEVKDDPERTIAITMLRTQRAYMTANSKMTPEELDQYTGQHSFGTLEYDYALYPHKGGWESAGVLDMAYKFKVGVHAVQSVPHNLGDMPVSGSLITIAGAKDLALAALKQADDGSGIILRVWNPGDKTVKASIKTKLPVSSAAECKLNESVEKELKVTRGSIAFESAPYKITTILLRY